MSREHPLHPIILFDGVCHLCQGSVNWLIRHDPQAKFRFAAIQSPAGELLLRKFHIDPIKLDSIILIEHHRYYSKSTAIFRIVRQLPGLYRWLYIGVILPRFMRNALYDYIASRRYRWFGRDETCLLPTPSIQARFLHHEDDFRS